MDHKQFSTIVGMLKSVYTDPKFLPDGMAIKVWYEVLKDIPYEVAADAATRYITTNSFPPTPADIRKSAMKNQSVAGMNELEAWGIVYKALGNSGYNYEKEFEKLPEMCKRTVRRPKILKEWSQLNIDEVQTVIKSNFERTYRAEVKKAEEFGQMPKLLREAVERNERKMIG